MLILRVTALRPIHGYAIVQRIQQISRDALEIRQGSLYPALYRLESRGWEKRMDAELRPHLETRRAWSRS
ncbi:MAG TPA: helix-turn-helix transcriptional regulator [Bryobacteraceae bacterium]|nr:helix-turn-helix transcriptional regulator [Bryobacteraceae bacterium]